MSVRAKIEACVDKFIADGGVIVDEDWNVEFRGDRYVAGEYKEACDADPPEGDGEKPACCPLGAVLVAHDPRGWVMEKNADAAALLGVSENWVANFIGAFDGGDEGDIPERLSRTPGRSASTSARSTSVSEIAWVKEFLDAELFGKLLKDWPHQMKLTTFANNPDRAVVMVFLESGAFADDVIGLLLHGAKIDYFRNPMKLEANTLFGGDGMPTFMKVNESGGACKARLLHVVGERQLIVEVRRVSDDINGAVADGQAFYDKLEKELKVKPDEIVKKYGAS